MNDTVLLPMASWQRDAAETSGPVFLKTYRDRTLMTDGFYASARSAMEASEHAVWHSLGNKRWASENNLSIIEPGRN